MSGLEVAGIVLAVLPLFISAFEHYEKGLRPFQRFFNYEQEASRYRITLLVQYTNYSQTLEYLLTEFVDKDELDDMVTRGYGELWKNPELTTNLQRQLGTAYESFRIVLAQIFDDMERLARILDIERQGQVTGPQLETLVASHKPKQTLPRRSLQSYLRTYEFQKKLKFSHKGRHIQPLLDALEQHNKQLGSFTETSKNLVKARSKASRRAFSTPLHHVQEGAERLHRVLSGTWICSRHASHVVNLMLDPRIDLPNSTSKEHDSLNSVTFYLTVPSQLSPSVFLSFQIQVLNGTGTTAQVQSKVSFVTSPPATATQIDVTNLPRVDCLCTAMEESLSKNCVGFCLDHQERLLGNYPPSQKHQNNHKHASGVLVSLKNVVSASASELNHRKAFTSSQSCFLGLTVASSFIQLQSTPWLCSQWRAEDVYFVQQGTDPKLLDFERPFVRQTYLRAATTSQHPISGNAGAATTPVAAIEDRYAFLRLGIMLLEIFSGEPFPSSQSPAAGDQRMADLVTVNDWVEQEKGNMTNAFYNAISECISWFANPRADLRNDEFKREFIDQLLIPLRDELRMYVSATKTSGP